MKLPTLGEDSSPEQLLVGLNDYINAAEKLLDEKNMIDLAGLDSVVDALCARVVKLDSAQQRQFADKLEQLGARLSVLQKKMVATQAALKEEMSAASKRQQASKAYRQEPK